MIVELCGTDLLKLVNGEQVVVGDLIVRAPEGRSTSNFNAAGGTGHQLGANLNSGGNVNTADRTAQQIRQSRSNARQKLVGAKKPTKIGQRWMNAIYPGGCYMDGCPNAWKKGALILYDYDTRRALCEGHGEREFPKIPKPQEVTT